MMEIGISVSGALNFPSGQDMTSAIRRGMKIVGEVTANRARLNADGRPGPFVRTGRLRASINSQVSSDGMTVIIGTSETAKGKDVSYAPRIEMGFSGSVTVKEHFARNPGPTAINARGRRVRAQGPANMHHVKEFTYNANSPAYPFLRPAVDEQVRTDRIARILQAEIDKAVNS